MQQVMVKEELPEHFTQRKSLQDIGIIRFQGILNSIGTTMAVEGKQRNALYLITSNLGIKNLMLAIRR